MKLIIISGRSGSGKTAAIQSLEDLGYYCIDNLPAALLPQLANHMEATGLHQQVAIGIDARNQSKDLATFPEIIEQLKNRNTQIEIVYLDAQNDILLQRYSSTRRKHPLSTPELSLIEAIEQESVLLDPVNKMATLILDTTNLGVQTLRQLIQDRVAKVEYKDIALLFESFGFKHGIPAEADFIFDVRCLPNPYWVPELRRYTGMDEPIEAFLSKEPDVENMYNDIFNFIDRWVEKFRQNNRSYLTIAIGCTGGQHRSVYLVEQLTKGFYSRFSNIQKRHRELKH